MGLIVRRAGLQIMMDNLKAPLEPKLAQITDGSVAAPPAPISEKEKALAPVSPQAILDVVPSFSISLQEAKARVSMLQQFVAEMMTAGVDYGIVPGCPKPTLLKAGAEKLCDVFGFSKHFEVTHRLEDWENGFFHYEIKVTLWNKRTGLIESEGVGSCNNRERKYSKQDAFTLPNTIIKMAKKRSLVDAILAASRSSGLFSQDLDNIYIPPVSDNNPSVKKEATVPNTTVASSDSKPIFPMKPDADTSLPTTLALVTENQLNFLRTLIIRKQISGSEARTILQDRYRVTNGTELTKAQASDLIAWLQDH